MTPAEENAEWLDRRLADLQRREFDRSLEGIGINKPLGGHRLSPVATLWHALVALGRGHGTVLSQNGPRLFLYVYSPGALAQLLLRHDTTLAAAGWPLDPEAFVRRVIEEPVEPLTPLFGVIAAAYGDTTNPGLPGTVQPREKLRLFREVAGMPDPVEVYFRIHDAKRGR